MGLKGEIQVLLLALALPGHEFRFTWGGDLLSLGPRAVEELSVGWSEPGTGCLEWLWNVEIAIS